VFQPIVELTSTAIVGYEALTRFLDGTPPERVFAEAAACDRSVDLEAATLAAILAASGPLPTSAWLNLNVSPELVLAREPLRSMLGSYRRQTVLELTEHIEIADYGPSAQRSACSDRVSASRSTTRAPASRASATSSSSDPPT
jgi:EAL domain-containing protein (putative c-di-GMP-specific phosphodiesterase class I)